MLYKYRELTLLTYFPVLHNRKYCSPFRASFLGVDGSFGETFTWTIGHVYRDH
jgi:hypothetical protein